MSPHGKFFDQDAPDDAGSSGQHPRRRHRAGALFDQDTPDAAPPNGAGRPRQTPVPPVAGGPHPVPAPPAAAEPPPPLRFPYSEARPVAKRAPTPGPRGLAAPSPPAAPRLSPVPSPAAPRSPDAPPPAAPRPATLSPTAAPPPATSPPSSAPWTGAAPRRPDERRRTPAPPPAGRRPSPVQRPPVTPAGPAAPAPAGRPRPRGTAEALSPAATRAPSPRRDPSRPPAPREPPRASLGRNTGLLAAGTFLSRLTGFARVVIAAAILGLNGVGTAYNFANSVPNIVYDLLLGGILSATLIPVFVDELRRDDAGERDQAISAVLTTIAAALFVLTIGLYLLAPLVIHFYLLLNHTSARGAELAVGTSLLRLFAPQIFFLGAIVVSTALLNARRQFAAAAFSPVLNNVIAIAALVATDVVAKTLNIGAFRHDRNGLLVLGIGTTLGYGAQFAVQLPAMARSGLRLRPLWAPRHPAVVRVVKLSAWLFGVVLANQVAYNLIAVIAGQNNQDFPIYQTAYQFFQLPYALFAVSIASAIMPDLATLWTVGDLVAFRRRLISGVRVTLALLVPAAIGYALLARPAIDLLVHHGAVHPSQANLLGGTVEAFALGLPGFSAFLPLIRALQAMKDTRAMFVIYAFENALTIVLAFALYPPLGVPGLAVAFAGPYTVAAIIAAGYLRRKVGSLGGVYTGRSLTRVVLATAVMAAVLGGLGHAFAGASSDAMLAFRLLVEVGVGTVVYLGAARWLGVRDLRPVLRPVGAILRRMSGTT